MQLSLGRLLKALTRALRLSLCRFDPFAGRLCALTLSASLARPPSGPGLCCSRLLSPAWWRCLAGGPNPLHPTEGSGRTHTHTHTHTHTTRTSSTSITSSTTSANSTSLVVLVQSSTSSTSSTTSASSTSSTNSTSADRTSNTGCVRCQDS